MKALLPLAALLLLGGCDSAQSGQPAATTQSVAEATTATRPTYDSLVSEPAGSAPVQSIGSSAQRSTGYGGGGGSVEYHNASTGTSASYDLDVEYDGDGDVWRINFPSGGYIGQHHITDQTHNGDGTITVTTDTGQEFTVDEEDGKSGPSPGEDSDDDE